MKGYVFNHLNAPCERGLNIGRLDATEKVKITAMLGRLKVC